MKLDIPNSDHLSEKVGKVGKASTKEATIAVQLCHILLDFSWVITKTSGGFFFETSQPYTSKQQQLLKSLA